MRVLSIGRIEWLRFFRDRIALFSTIALPIVLVLLIGLSFGQSRAALPVGVLSGAPGPLGAELVAQMRQSPGVQVQTYDERTDMYRDIRMGLLAGGVEIGPDGDPVQIDVQQTSQDAGALVATVEAAAAAVGTRVLAVEALSAEVPAGEARRAVAAAEKDVQAVVVTTRTVGAVSETEANRFASAVPSQLMLFTFLNGLIGAAALVQAREVGVFQRTLAAPQGRRTYLAGMGLSRFGIAVLQAVILLGLGILMFRIDLGDPLAWAPLVLVYGVVCAAAGMALGAVVRTSGQAVAIAIPLGIVCGMLGGTMWPLSVVGPLMRAIGHFTPQAWAMDAWTRIINEGAGLPGIALELSILAVYAAVLTALALMVLGRRARTGR